MALRVPICPLWGLLIELGLLGPLEFLSIPLSRLLAELGPVVGAG